MKLLSSVHMILDNCVCVRAGLAFDSWDLDYYTALFQRVKRNPTSVECFDLAQSNRCVGLWLKMAMNFCTLFSTEKKVETTALRLPLLIHFHQKIFPSFLHIGKFMCNKYFFVEITCTVHNI